MSLHRLRSPEVSVASPFFRSASLTRISGCFQCSKRRITCDLGHPTCQKCIKKGIECSGLGRIRFNDGVARRGRFKGRQLPTLDPLAQDQEHFEQAPVKIRWQHRQHKFTENTGLDERSTKWRRLSSREPLVRSPNMSLPQSSNDFTAQARKAQSSKHINPGFVPFISQSSSLRPWLSPLNPEIRLLFSHCEQSSFPG